MKVYNMNSLDMKVFYNMIKSSWNMRNELNCMGLDSLFNLEDFIWTWSILNLTKVRINHKADD